MSEKVTAQARGRRGRISRRAAVRAFLVVVGFFILTNAPYAVAAARTPPGTQFAGVIFNDQDQHWYLSVQRSVGHDLDSQNRYTTEEDAPVLVSPLYLAMGSVQRLLHLPTLFTYHAFRALLGLALPVLAFWCFRTAYPSDPWAAAWATLLAIFNVGIRTLLGDVTPGFVSRATDWNVPESNSLITAAVFPHITLAKAGVIVLLGSLLLAVRDASFKKVALVGAAGGFLVSFSHVFLLAPFYLAAGVLILGTAVRASITRQTLRPSLALATALLAVTVVSTPFVLSILAQSRRFERIEGRAYPLTPSDAWWTWLMGYGVLVPLAILGLAAALAHRHHLKSVAVLVVWTACQVPLLYGFTNFLRRFSEGLVFPIAGLAGLGVSALRTRLRASRPTATAALVGFLVPASIIASYRLGVPAMYVPDAYREAFSRVDRDDIVLAGDYPSIFLPGRTDATAFVSREVLTLHFQRKADERRRFSLDPTSVESLDWLKKTGVNTLIVDTIDSSFTIDQTRLTQPCFSRSLSAGTVSVYRFNRLCASSRGAAG